MYITVIIIPIKVKKSLEDKKHLNRINLYLYNKPIEVFMMEIIG